MVPSRRMVFMYVSALLSVLVVYLGDLVELIVVLWYWALIAFFYLI